MTRRRSERGSATLETVVLWPAVFVLIFGIVHAGLWFHARNIALSAAREGARAASMAGGTGGAARAADFLTATTDGRVMRVGDIHEVADTDTVTVTVSGSSTTLIPGWRVDVSQSATAPIRRWTAP
ncbi:pilus assembly protein [Jiangella aurantiaca]|uniref:Pilus assembly protein n=1 Tax=Jiangella aurantiaca TaxID=2530373 RepID=A0A4V2YRP1_9ACTN|nr:TadE family protein [Jiangella aurantiaca]TDD66987.1 pilus assembly protein [Jiangella aurantiaca]